jgi:hypothetical protein
MNRTGLIGHIKEDVIGIITIVDYTIELIFNLQIIILAEDIINSEIPT